MSNGEVCCILGVCCPPGSAEQRTALVHEIQKRHPSLTDDIAGKKADKALKKFDYFKGLATIIDKDVTTA
jgi:hypothetical protein